MSDKSETFSEAYNRFQSLHKVADGTQKLLFIFHKVAGAEQKQIFVFL